MKVSKECAQHRKSENSIKKDRSCWLNCKANEMVVIQNTDKICRVGTYLSVKSRIRFKAGNHNHIDPLHIDVDHLPMR